MASFTQPKKLKANIVTDDQGRQRFHGAFTGGFSAGHFNTVGSEEGFQPKAFVSSRSNRADHRRANASDFMDTEDGLAGSLTSKNDFDTFDTNSKKLASKALEQASSRGAIPGFMPNELIVVNTNSIGKRLLTLMGWREGQGVGARKVKKSFTKPESLKMEAISTNALDEGMITFAPNNDVNLVEIPPPKSDLHGVGYDYELDNSEMATIRKEMQSEKPRSGVYRVDDVLGKGGPHNAVKFSSLSGFALNDDEDDVYDLTVDPRRKMGLLPSSVGVREDHSDDDERVSLGPDIRRLTDSDNKLNDWLESSQKEAKLRERCSDGRHVLQGFTFGKVMVEIPPSYPPIEVPKDFEPGHRFEEELLKSVPGEMGAGGKGKLSVSDLQKRRRAEGKTGLVEARAALLGDGDQRPGSKGAAGTVPPVPPGPDGKLLGSGAPDSVFAMLSEEAREKIRRSIAGGAVEAGKDGAGLSAPVSSLHFPPPPPPPPHLRSIPPQPLATASQQTQGPAPAPVPERPMLVSGALLNSAFAGLSQSFKSRFVTSSDKGSDPTLAGAGAGEGGLATAEEHAKALAKRAPPVPPAGSTSAQAKVLASIGAGGKTGAGSGGGKHIPSRISLPWGPAPLLCKRFNVPVPSTSEQQQLSSRTSNQPGVSENVPSFGSSQSQDPGQGVQGQGQRKGAATSDRESVIYDKFVGRFVQPQFGTAGDSSLGAGPGAGSAKRDREGDAGVGHSEGSLEALMIDEFKPRPPMALFKSIFEDSSSSDSGDSEDDDDDDSGTSEGGEEESTGGNASQQQEEAKEKRRTDGGQVKMSGQQQATPAGQPSHQITSTNRQRQGPSRPAAEVQLSTGNITDDKTEGGGYNSRVVSAVEEADISGGPPRMVFRKPVRDGASTAANRGRRQQLPFGRSTSSINSRHAGSAVTHGTDDEGEGDGDVGGSVVQGVQGAQGVRRRQGISADDFALAEDLAQFSRPSEPAADGTTAAGRKGKSSLSLLSFDDGFGDEFDEYRRDRSGGSSSSSSSRPLALTDVGRQASDATRAVQERGLVVDRTTVAFSATAATASVSKSGGGNGTVSEVLFQNLKHVTEIKGLKGLPSSSAKSAAPPPPVAAARSKTEAEQARLAAFDPLVHEMLAPAMAKLHSALLEPATSTSISSGRNSKEKRKKKDKHEKKSKSKSKKEKKEKKEKKSKKSKKVKKEKISKAVADSDSDGSGGGSDAADSSSASSDSDN